MAALNIAFEAPVNVSEPCMTRSRPIDLVHLAIHAKGDKALEIEVLQAFARQARKCLINLASEDGGEIGNTVNRLKHAADQVGAVRVSAAAERLERDGASAANLAVTSAAVVEAENFILKLCR